jgi:5'-deoxynucleotidase YfbR-like HD superfamily hydrolase
MISHRNWVQTASGAAVDLLSPNPATIHPSDIVTALTRLVRFNGHTIVPYTVAQHSVLVSNLVVVLAGKAGVDVGLAYRLAILHDAHEAYVGDIVNPVIWLGDIAKPINALKDRLQGAIHARFGVAEYEIDVQTRLIVDYADRLACAVEKRDILADCAVPWVGLPDIPAMFSRDAGLDLRSMLLDRRLAGFEALLHGMVPV